MKSNKLFFIACMLTVMLSGCTKPTEVRFKAMTYNTYSNRNSSLEEIARIVREANPDLLAIQEVERFTDINPGDVPAQLSKLTGMPYYYFIHALDIRKGGDYGNAILSKYPITDTASYKLYGVEEKDYVRSFGYARVEINGQQFYFATTHIDHKQDDASRRKMVSSILPTLRKLNAPVILVGDFNDTPHSPTLTMFNGLADMYGGPDWQTTCPAPTDPTSRTIDYILGIPCGTFMAESYKVYYEAANASDHYPVVGEFRFRGLSEEKTKCQ